MVGAERCMSSRPRQAVVIRVTIVMIIIIIIIIIVITMIISSSMMIPIRVICRIINSASNIVAWNNVR